jgi:hypothetical protein
MQHDVLDRRLVGGQSTEPSRGSHGTRTTGRSGSLGSTSRIMMKASARSAGLVPWRKRVVTGFNGSSSRRALRSPGKTARQTFWIAEGDASVCARLSAEEVLQLIGSLCPAPKRRKPSPRLSRRKINETT